MRMPMDVDLAKWLDSKTWPWKPKDDAPEDIKKRINEWIEKFEERKKMIDGK